jgi:molybdopterin/thiamine biosynthesis adenylyltransferase/nitroreductase
MGEKESQVNPLPRPEIFNDDSTRLQELMKDESVTKVDHYDSMRRELEEIRTIGKINLPVKPGNWVYLPWSKKLVHILAEVDYQSLRTARNLNIDTTEEQEKFGKFVVGVAGLSVGNSVALALAYSGGSLTMKLADPDFLDGSNLNRIRAGIGDLGTSKVVIAAQQIYEINPYANLILYPDGLSENNLEDFIAGTPKLDLVVDEMDNLKLKVFIRLLARTARIPLVMATDNGNNVLVDIDRYDLDPNKPPFDQLPEMDIKSIIRGIGEIESLELSPEERVRFATALVGAANIEPRMQSSLMDVGRNLISWPQLAIAAFTGGSSVAYVIKQIALGKRVKSGKVKLSLDETFLEGYVSEEETKKRGVQTETFLNFIGQNKLTDQINYSVWGIDENDYPKSGDLEDKLRFLLNYAILAPSTHNTQPWQFRIKDNKIEVLADMSRALPVSDPTNREMYLTLGTVLTNIVVTGHHFGFQTQVNRLPDQSNKSLIATIQFDPGQSQTELSSLFPAITQRHSNRHLYDLKPLPSALLDQIISLNGDPTLVITLLTDRVVINQIGELLASGSQQMMKDEAFRGELSAWLRHNATKEKDGMPGFTLGLDPIQAILGSFLIKNYDMGESQSQKDKELLLSSSALGVISASTDDPLSWVKAGELFEKILLLTTLKGVQHSVYASLVELGDLHEKLESLLQLSGRAQLFFRLGYSDTESGLSPRRPLSEVLK